MGLRDSLAMQLRAAYFSLRRTAQVRLAATGATADQVVVMSLLAEEPALTQSEIAELTYSDPSTVRAILVLLEQRGWVRRASDPGDARVRRVTLTAEGRKQQRRLQRIGHIGNPTNVERLLSDDETRVVMDCLKRIVARQSAVAAGALADPREVVRESRPSARGARA